MNRQLTKSDMKTLSLSSLGGTLEFYDFIIFAIFTPYFTHHFFPADLDENLKLFNTYGAFAAGYLARPLGGIVMAHFGDKFGRKKMFMLSILLMAIPTFTFAIMPTYEQIGWLAIVILLLIRITQGIAIGGELPGAWVFVYEHSPANTKNLFIGVLTCGVCGGILLGNIVTLILQNIFIEDDIKEYAYRIPFLLGGIFGLISVYLRRFLKETPIFKELQANNELHSFPLKDVIKEFKKDISLSVLLTWIMTACVLVMIILMPNFLKSTYNIEPITNTIVQMGGTFMMMVGLVCTGALSDIFHPAQVCKTFAVFLFIFCFLYFYEFYIGKNLTLICVYYLIACFFTGIVNFTAIFMCNLYRPNVLFSGISFSYNLAYAFFGFITPLLLVKFHSNVELGGIFIIGGGAYMCYISILAFINAKIFLKIKKD